MSKSANFFGKVAVAHMFGKLANEEGKKDIPFLDREFMVWLASLDLPIGAEALTILKAWHQGWHEQNLK